MRFVIFFILLHPLILSSQDLLELDKKNGYKDITFDMRFDSLQKVTKIRKSMSVDETGPTRYDLRDSKYQKISDIPVDPAIGVFQNNIIYFRLIVWNWNKYKDQLVKMFTGLYGDPIKTGSIEEVYTWDGIATKLQLVESYGYNFGMVYLESKENESAMQEKLKEKAKQKASDF